MRKRITTIALVAALAASQSVCTFAANSPGTGPVISGGGSDGSSYDAGIRTNTATKNGTNANTVQFGGGVQTNSRGQAVVGDTALELVKDTGSAVAGLPESVVNAINSINSGRPLDEAVPGVDLTGYSALVGTQAIVTKDVATNDEKAGVVEVPMYIPNLVDGLGNVQVLFYNNLTGTWTVIQPTRIDIASKMLYFNIPNSGTVSVIYKR